MTSAFGIPDEGAKFFGLGIGRLPGTGGVSIIRTNHPPNIPYRNGGVPMIPLTCPRSITGRTRLSIRPVAMRSEEHTSELQSQSKIVCRLLLEKKNDPLSEAK